MLSAKNREFWSLNKKPVRKSVNSPAWYHLMTIFFAFNGVLAVVSMLNHRQAVNVVFNILISP